MQGNTSEIFETVNHVWGDEQRGQGSDGKVGSEKIFPKKSTGFGLDDKRLVHRVFKFSSPGVKKESVNYDSESGELIVNKQSEKSKRNFLYSPSLESKTWVYSTPCTRHKEKKPAPDSEENHKKFQKTEYTTPSYNISKKNIGSQIFPYKQNLLLNSESIEDESFQRKEQKKTVEMLRSLKDDSFKMKVQDTEKNLSALQELINKCYDLRERQIEFLNQIIDYELPDLQEIPSTILQFNKSAL